MLRTLFAVLKLEAQIAVVLLRIVLAALTWLWRLIDRHQKATANKSQPPKLAQVAATQTSQIRARVAQPPPPEPIPVNPDAARILGNPDGKLYIATATFMTEHPRSAELLKKMEEAAYIAQNWHIPFWELPIAPEEQKPEPEPIPLPEPDGKLWIATSEGFQMLQP